MTNSKKLTWKFPRPFWIANSIELFERAAYYGMFIALTLYLTREVGFTDVESGWVVGVFAGIGVFVFCCLLVYRAVTDSRDKRKQAVA